MKEPQFVKREDIAETYHPEFVIVLDICPWQEWENRMKPYDSSGWLYEGWDIVYDAGESEEITHLIAVLNSEGETAVYTYGDSGCHCPEYVPNQTREIRKLKELFKEYTKFDDDDGE
jgi:hypothetical protein